MAIADGYIELADGTSAQMIVHASGSILWRSKVPVFARMIAAMRKEEEISPADGDPNAAVVLAVVAELESNGERIAKFAWKNAYKHVPERVY